MIPAYMRQSMSMNKNKISRREALSTVAKVAIGSGVAIVVAGGVAAYLATRPPQVVEKIVTVEKPVERTVVTTVAGVPTTVIETRRETVVQTATPTVRPKVTMWKGPHTPDDPGVYAPIVQAFKSQNPDIDVEFVSVPWDQLSAKLASGVASGTVCDVAYLPSVWMYQYANQGALVELETLPNFNEVKAQPYKSTPWRAGQFMGHQYGIPYLSVAVVVMYNKDIFEKAGVGQPPKNWEELIEVAKQIHSPDKGIYALGMPLGWEAYVTHWCSSLLYSYGANVPLSFGKPIPGVGDNDMTLNTDAGVEGMTMMKRMWEYSQKGKLTRGEVTDLFFAGKIGMVPHESFTVPLLDKHPEIRAGVFQMPEGPVGRYTYGESGYISIFKQTKNLDATWKFARFITSRDQNKKYLEASYLFPARDDIEIEEFTKGKYADIYQEYIKAVEYGRYSMYSIYGEELGRMQDDIIAGGADIKSTLQRTAENIMMIIKASGFKL
jgi:ABC-type glycerol-3-phosphate transport system substrate-binding protein